MNLLEHYISNDYKLIKLSKDKAPTSDTTWYQFEGTVDCYGSLFFNVSAIGSSY